LLASLQILRPFCCWLPCYCRSRAFAGVVSSLLLLLNLAVAGPLQLFAFLESCSQIHRP